MHATDADTLTRRPDRTRGDDARRATVARRCQRHAKRGTTPTRAGRRAALRD